MNMLHRMPFVCEGYIIISEKVAEINKMFARKNLNLYFKPHRRVIIIVDNLHLKDFNIDEARASTELHDLDLIIITKENNSDCFKYKCLRFLDQDFQIRLVLHSFKTHKPWYPLRILTKHQQNFSVAMFNCPPFASFNETTNLHDGLEIKMLDMILNKWPKTYIVFKPKAGSGDQLYGKVLDEVILGNSDLSLCSQWLQKVYEFDVSKTTEYAVTCKNILVPRPKLLPNYSFMFQSVKTSLWLLYFFTLIVCSCIARVMYFMVAVPSQNLIEITIRFIRIFSLGAISKMPKKTATRFFLTTVFIFCLITSTYYSAGLTTSLRFPQFSKNIDNIQHIVENNIKWLEPNDWMMQWMKNTTSDSLHKLADLFEVYYKISDRNIKLRQDDYALLVQTLSSVNKNYYVMFSESLDGYGKQHLKIISEDVACFYAVFPLKENSPYVEIFNSAILKFIEYGFINHWFQDFINKPQYRFMKNFFQTYSTEVHQVIDLEKLQGAFYFLLVGEVLSGISFLIEHIVYNKYVSNQ
ncbi:hypothetical protein Zmor_001107 [Zophobas morio]|uniref:Ionotropic glutamate receptor C-terminal domain-containing protein n=1 Tax=Zophobas morio TaxID=2755281 RepID=A0AA38MSC7_9CUCU|nr:hypothetical protein Zmor_001107 [Zophobas morio]